MRDGGVWMALCVLLAVAATASADLLRGSTSTHSLARGGRVHHLTRRGRNERDSGSASVATGGIDFSSCVQDRVTGLCCVEKEEMVTSLEKEPILECTHKETEQCHYTYVTQFTPSQEEVCEENFEKSCSITFKKLAYNETVRKCYRPVEKVCNGQGPEVCRTVYESSCTTKYVEKSPGKFVGDTGCEKLPVEICGAGCTFEEGVEECHDKIITSLVDAPEEICDLNPQKTCRFVTKLVPKLAPKHECTIVPRESCQLKFSQPRRVAKRLITRWCLDRSGPAPGESFTDVLSEPSDLSSYQQDHASKTVQDKSFVNLFSLRTDDTPKQLNKFTDDADVVVTTEYPDYAYEYDYQDKLVEASDYNK